jgi:hypothetical protein
MKLVTTRRVLILTLLTIVGMGSYVVYFTQVVNPRVMHELQAEPDGERAQRVLRLTLPNGKTLPINYLREGETVYLGADFGWWKAIDASGTPVELLLRGQVRRGMARVVLDDPQRTKSVFARLRPSAPAWLPAWLNGKLVVIDLDQEQ